MKRLVFSLFCVMMLGFSSCLDPSDNINHHQDIPAIVGISYETFQPTIITSLGTFLATELQSGLYTELLEGDAIWTYFSVNYDQPTASGEYIAYDLQYFKIETGWAQATEGGESMSGDFDTPIEDMWVADLIGNVMFFVFEHTAPADQQMTYELTYDSSETSELEVCIRAKKDYTEGTQSVGALHYPFTFNLYSFFMTHRDADNWVKFRIKYKTGVDDDENDKYEYFNNGSYIEIQLVNN